MRVVNLSDGPNHIRDNYITELEIYTIYPEDADSREQALLLLNHEHQKWRTVGHEEYASSALVETLLTSYRGTASRRFLCGAVAIAMCALQNAGRPVSLESAADIVAEFANTKGKLPFSFWQNGEWIEQPKALIGDRQKLKQAFRQYRSVAHMLAAWVASGEYVDLQRPFDRGPEADACMLHTAAYYQCRLSKVHNFSDWNLWHIAATPPFAMGDYPPFEPSQDLIVWLLQPWLDSQGL